MSDFSSAKGVTATISRTLAKCPTTNYLVVFQPGVSSSDFVCRKTTPFMNKRIGSPSQQHTAVIARDVVGTINRWELAAPIRSSCNKRTREIQTDDLSFPVYTAEQLQNSILSVSLPSLQSTLLVEDRKVVLSQHDTYLSSLVQNYFNDSDYTLIYVTESMHTAEQKEHTSHEYDAEVPLADVMHGGELVRRTLMERKSKSSSNQTVVDGPLFDKYQFFTPGMIFALLLSRTRLIKARHFYGSSRRIHSFVYSICRHFCSD